MNAPVYCRPEAYHLFADSLPALGTTQGLIQAALSLSLHALDDFPPGEVERRLDEMAARVLARVQRHRTEALVAHLHHVLFDEEEFAGEYSNYYSPLSSYLPAVLTSKRGIPIMLALIYKAVGERVGLEVDGINTPGHFLVRVHDSHGWLLIDPYHHGKVLTQDEALKLVNKIFDGNLEFSYEMFEPATHAQWIERILLNLRSSLNRCGWRSDLGAMNELQSLLRGTHS
jgi:regulator of sirC expression with transglutaminase-like and TPR domain